MPRDIRRLTIGIKFAEKKYGATNIEWAKDISWIRIHDFKLPENFRQKYTNMLILVPENYGYGGCLKDTFINADLELLDRQGKSYTSFDSKVDPIFHGYREFPYSSMTSEQKNIFSGRNWFYLCLHDLDADGSLTSYLEKVQMYLGNPYKDWKSISTVYRKA